MIGRVTLVVALSAGFLAGPQTAYAAPAAEAEPVEAADPKIERAKELLENGANLYNEGSYEAAILAFQEGYDLTEEPAFLYNIGNCYERLGNFSEARRYLDQYRAFAPEGERDILARRISALDERLRKQREEEAANPGEPADTPDPDTQNTPPPVEPTPAEPEKPERLYGPAAMALTGVAVLGLGIGVGFGVKANNERKTALDGCVDLGSEFLCSAASQDALDSRRTSALIADIGFVVAGAATIGVITAIAVKAGKRKGRKADVASRRSRFSPYASGRGAGFVLSGRF